MAAPPPYPSAPALPHQQPGYPPQPGYPQQPVYPQQSGYPQPGYPAQPTQQPGYPQGPGAVNFQTHQPGAQVAPHIPPRTTLVVTPAPVVRETIVVETAKPAHRPPRFGGFLSGAIMGMAVEDSMHHHGPHHGGHHHGHRHGHHHGHRHGHHHGHHH